MPKNFGLKGSKMSFGGIDLWKIFEMGEGAEIFESESGRGGGGQKLSSKFVWVKKGSGSKKKTVFDGPKNFSFYNLTYWTV